MVKGNIVTGLGKGAYFINKYQDYLKEALGFECFPGTLNVKVDETVKHKYFKKNSLIVNEKSLGGVDFCLVKINQMYEGAVLFPHKTKHDKNIIEIVASVNLRKELKLNDGDEIECELV